MPREWVLIYLYPELIHLERVSHYKKYENDLNFDGIKFPNKINDILRFEKQNDGSAIFQKECVKVKMLPKYNMKYLQCLMQDLEIKQITMSIYC